MNVVLRKRVIVSDEIIFDAERNVELPVEPFVGLVLYNTEWRPAGCDDSEDRIEHIAFDLRALVLYCEMPIDDYRREAAYGDVWTEEEVRQRYRDWSLSENRANKPQPEEATP